MNFCDKMTADPVLICICDVVVLVPRILETPLHCLVATKRVPQFDLVGTSLGFSTSY